MADFGRFALALTFFLTLYALLVDLLGTWRKNHALTASARNATIASFFSLTAATVTLVFSFILDDFSIQYVSAHSSRALPLAYKLSALWAGAAGSLLFWLWLQVGFAVAVFCRHTRKHDFFIAAARCAVNLVSVFFVLVLIWDKNPFTLNLLSSADGAGLNPLLQHPAMALHPPTLFIGYAAFIIPFAWTFAALSNKNTQGPDPLFAQARNWILRAWLFLTIGIVLGAWWAYEELGWGGYWSWDPVENSSLLPWLAATAMLHCSRTYKKRTPSASWMMVFGILTFSLCIFGTFLTRYGLVPSVHAFPETGLGILFIVLIICIWLIAITLFWLKYKHQKDMPLPSVGRGQKFIILNNWIMLLLIFVILLGTIFPFLSGLFTGQKLSLQPEYFTKITAPGGFLLLLLLSICPNLVSRGLNSRWRVIAAVIVAIAAAVAWFLTKQLSPACFIICAFAAVNIISDFTKRFIKTIDPCQPSPPLNLRWSGARIVHIGVVLTFIGIAGSGGYGTEQNVSLKPDQTVNVAGYDLTYQHLTADHGPNYTAVTAQVSVKKDGRHLTTLSPALAYYNASGQRASEVDIRRTLAGDLYLALTEVDNSTGLINLNILVKPLINWIWLGSTISVLGTVIVLISFYKKKGNL